MSHEIETFAYAGEVPWHGLGKRVPADLSPEQMLKTAELDWTVRKVPAYVDIDGSPVMLGKSALVRSSDNAILDTVSNDWVPNQNIEAFNYFDEFVKGGGVQMHTAGSLKGGKIVFALAKAHDSFEVFGGDQVDSYLLFTNPHEFGKSIDVRFTPIRVVCNNTLTLSLRTKGKGIDGGAWNVSTTHRSAFDPKKVKEAMNMASLKMDRYKEMAEFLGSKRFTKESLEAYMTAVFPKMVPSAKRDEEEDPEMSGNGVLALSLMDTQPGAEFAQGSWWQAFNAVTFMIDHKVGRSVDTRMTSAWTGLGRSNKVKALERAIEMATVS